MQGSSRDVIWIEKQGNMHKREAEVVTGGVMVVVLMMEWERYWWDGGS